MVFLKVLCAIIVVNFPVFTCAMYKPLCSKVIALRAQKNNSFKLLATRPISAQEKEVRINEHIQKIIAEGFQLASLAQETKRMNDQSYRLINAMNDVNLGMVEKQGIVQLVDGITVSSCEDQENLCWKLKDANINMKRIYDAEWNCLVAMIELLRRMRENEESWFINAQRSHLEWEQRELDRLKKESITK